MSDLSEGVLRGTHHLLCAVADQPDTDKHLPECALETGVYDDRADCVCDALHACELRVRTEPFDVAYLAALHAAKIALRELETDMANWSSDETRAATDVFPKLTADQWMWAQYGVGRSLQVINVLSHTRTENSTGVTQELGH